MMTKEIKTVNIADFPELLRLVEEVRESNEARVLRRDGEDLAILLPAARKRRRPGRAKSPADLEAFRSAAGSWRDVDTDKLVEDSYESRRRSSRPAVQL